MFFVVVRNFAYNALSSIAKITGNISNLNEETVFLELPKHQFIPYEVNEKDGEMVRTLTPINKWTHREDAYVKIIDQLINEIK